MKSRFKVFGVLAAALLALLAVPAGNTRAAPIVLKASHFLPPEHSLARDLAAWGEELKAKSKGQLELQIFPANQLAPPPKHYDLAASGEVDIAMALHGYTPGRFPLTEVAQLPFVVREAAASSVRLTELAPQYLAKEHAGVKILLLVAAAPSKIHLARKRIDSIRDFKGLRLRFSGSAAGESVRALGGIPIEMPPAKVADAMKSGELDGTIFPYEAVKTFRINEVSKYSVEPGFSSVTFFVVMNRKRYESLPKHLRDLIDATTGPAAARRFGAHLDEQENIGRKAMIDSGVEIVRLSDAAISRMEAATLNYTRRVLSDLEKRGLPANTVYLEMVSANASVR